MVKDKGVETYVLDSILDLNATNVWNVSEHEIKRAWEDEQDDGSFSLSEDKLLNIIRLCFEVVHYNVNDQRESDKYENGEWVTFQHCNKKKGWVAIRRKHITRLSDLSYENVRHITAATLLELIDRNFGGGWDSISLSQKDIILSAFDISNTTLPAKRMHMEGGTLDKKLAQGFEVLEIVKGTWIEAIFAKKKEPVAKLHLNDDKYDENGNLRKGSAKGFDDDDEDAPDVDNDSLNEDMDDSIDDEQLDETFYSNFSEGVNPSGDGDGEDEDLGNLNIDSDEE